MGTRLSLVHLWESRDAPEAHTALAPGGCPWSGRNLHVCSVQFPDQGDSPACSWEKAFVEDSLLVPLPASPCHPQACLPSEVPRWGGGRAELVPWSIPLGPEALSGQLVCRASRFPSLSFMPRGAGLDDLGHQGPFPFSMRTRQWV